MKTKFQCNFLVAFESEAAIWSADVIANAVYVPNTKTG